MGYEAIKDMMGGRVLERVVAGFAGAILANLLASVIVRKDLGPMWGYLLVSLPGGVLGVTAWTWLAIPVRDDAVRRASTPGDR